jgi:glycerophosphoryl diester phosphodiesterase
MPRVRRDYTRSPLAPLAYGAVRVLRARLPARAAAALRAGRCEVIMPHWLLVSPALVTAVHAAGGELYVWTVDDRRRIDHLEALGVDGITTNDPRLFHPRDEELAGAT